MWVGVGGEAGAECAGWVGGRGRCRREEEGSGGPAVSRGWSPSAKRMKEGSIPVPGVSSAPQCLQTCPSPIGMAASQERDKNAPSTEH